MLIVMEDRCVCCGASVPEGRMVCWACEHHFREATKMVEAHLPEPPEEGKA